METRLSFCKLLVMIVRVVQAQLRADQPRRSRDTAAVSPTPVERDDFTFFTTLLPSMSRRRVDAVVVGLVLVYPHSFYCTGSVL